MRRYDLSQPNAGPNITTADLQANFAHMSQRAHWSSDMFKWAVQQIEVSTDIVKREIQAI